MTSEVYLLTMSSSTGFLTPSRSIFWEEQRSRWLISTKRERSLFHWRTTRAARALGLTHQGLSKILDNRQSTLAGARRPKRTRRNTFHNLCVCKIV